MKNKKTVRVTQGFPSEIKRKLDKGLDGDRATVLMVDGAIFYKGKNVVDELRLERH